LQLLLTEVREGRVDVIVVYKMDRLRRSLADFAKLVEEFDAHEVVVRIGDPVLQHHVEHGAARVTVVCPGVTESELAESISDEAGRNEMKTFRRIAIPADAIARAVDYAIEQPDDVDVSELVVRPTASPF
jgi:NADP-dependent 3-hydroxy acid dehydrogenase YdfG